MGNNESSGGGTGLRIKEKEVEILGDEYINYATIQQLLEQNPNRSPEVVIKEEFRFSFKGYHLDISR